LAALIEAAPAASSAVDSERTLEDLAVIGAVAIDSEPEAMKPLAAAPAPVAKPRELKDTKPIKLAARVAKAKLEASRQNGALLASGAASAGVPVSDVDGVTGVTGVTGLTGLTGLTGEDVDLDVDVDTSRPITLLPPAASASAPPIVLPPARAAAFPVNHESFWKDEAFGDDTPLSADDMPRLPRIRRKRQIGLVAALGGALVITLYTLARSPQRAETPADSTVARTTARSPDTDQSPVTAASPAVAVAAPVPAPAAPVGIFEPEARVAPKLEPAADSGAAAKLLASADAQSIRQARRAARAAAQAKRAAAASDNPKPVKRAAAAEGNARAERGAGESGRPGLALPAAYVSRQDF
jgi:hypothetical protein